jgi:uncharacterized protein YecE (DUF72 family)
LALVLVSSVPQRVFFLPLEASFFLVTVSHSLAMEIHIGTSGWHYKHWKGPFYEERCPVSKMLESYVRHFDTVEINNSFYKLPSEPTFESWRDCTPEKFLFAVKGSRFITHNKKLKEPEHALGNFLPRAAKLGPKLGAVLWQLPPAWQINVERLDEFLSAVDDFGKSGRGRSKVPGLRHAIEFRNPTWLDEKTYAVLRRHDAAFCMYELAGFTTPFELTADWTYIRLHGPGGKYQGSYSTEQLREWADRIRSWRRKLKAVFVYFDNDQAGYAALNALELKRLVERDELRAA